MIITRYESMGLGRRTQRLLLLALTLYKAVVTN